MSDWEDLVPDLAETFGGQMPNANVSEQIADAYRRAPNTVLRLADQVAAAYGDGTAQNPWGLLRYRTKDLQAERDPTGKRTTSREDLARKAEQWIRTAGIHFDRETEIIDELFGDRGPLREHPQLQARMVEHWRKLRPLGEQVEAEAQARHDRYRQQRDAA